MTHFRRLVTESSTTGRGIWHEKSESLCAGFERLHVLCGESLCSETATFLKVGVTALIVAMADAGLAPGSAVQLADPLRALHSVAGDVTCRKPLKMADGSSKTAIEIQRHYLEQAEAHAGTGAMPAWAADVCRRWRAVLDQLEEGPVAVKKTLDWGSSPDWLYQIPHPGQHTAGVPASICWRHRPQNTGRSAPGKSTAAASVSVEKY
jgi:proteasome accessory factor A